MMGAQEAATAAVMANMRRAEVEQENGDILNELIEIKAIPTILNWYLSLIIILADEICQPRYRLRK